MAGGRHQQTVPDPLKPLSPTAGRWRRQHQGVRQSSSPTMAQPAMRMRMAMWLRPLPAFVSMLVVLVVDMEMLVLQRCVLQVHRIGGRP